MRKPIRASMIAAFSILLGTLALGCGDPASTTTGQGGSGGSGGGGGAGGLGGNGQGGTGGGTGCTEEATQACYSGAVGTNGVGQCKSGTQTCLNHQWGPCNGEVVPGAETCNGVDDDCNGQVDENFPSVTCGQGACQKTVDGCLNGMVPSCEPGAPAAETCDGTDEDCNGEIDNGINCPCSPDGSMRSCYSGGNGTVGVGECKNGSQTCVNGAWGACENEVLPKMEECDGKDNDCDGQNDENIPKINCGAGACLVTVDGCANGMVPTCTPGQPKPEACNGIDDDCNLFIDDGLGTLSCGMGGCAVTVPACSGGLPQTCVPGMMQMEVCDGVDNDCDGVTDEGNPGGGVSCNTMLPGVCATGTLNCTDGVLKCSPNTMATTESCDGKDNNCNGVVDEGNPGGNQTCMTGQPGACALGTTTCANGMLGCSATTMPKPEICDGVDNDCDMAIDEGTAGGMCTVPGKLGICAISSYVCQNGSLLCPQTVQPANSETCNGLDDTCNGTVDEGNPGGGGACTVPNKFGPCANGVFNCTNGNVTCTQTVFPASETCGYMVDNDCNGTVDNGCCPHSVCQAGPAMPSTCGNGCAAAVCSFGGGSWSYCCTQTWNNSCTIIADAACGAGTCCAHDVCTLGGPLANGCSSCISSICAAKPHCCTTGWNEICRDRTPTLCNGTSCTINGAQCPHSVCTTGANLNTQCNACVAAICAQNPSCCATGASSWNQTCVNLVGTVCTGIDPNWSCP
jgi:hypothetical protein